MNMMTHANVTALESQLPRFAPSAMALHNALHRRRHSLALPATSAEQDRPARLRLLAESTPLGREVECHLRVGDERLTLATSWRTLNALGAHPARRRALETVDAELAALWLESVWRAWLEPMETTLACEIRVEPLAACSAAPGADARDASTVTLAMALETAAGSHPFALTLGETLAIRLRPLFESRFPPRHASANAVTSAASVVAGHQWLTLDEWRSLAPGDVVILERPFADPAAVKIDIAGRSAAATLATHSLTLLQRPQTRRHVAAPPRTRQRHQEKNPMSKPPVDREHGSGAEQPDVDNASFDDLPVRLTCELGRLVLSLGELRELGEGSVLPLSRRPEQAVDLVVNGKRLGLGRLVAIGDDIGVQIERLALDDNPELDDGRATNDEAVEE